MPEKEKTNVTVIALAAIGVIGLLGFFGLLAFMWGKNGSQPQPQPVPVFQQTPQQLALPEAPFIPAQDLPVAYTAPVPLLTYDKGTRTTISSQGQQYMTWRSPFNGWLVGVTVFTSAIDSGDTYNLLLNGTNLKDSIYPVGGTAVAQDFNQPISAGDTVMLIYNSRGSTVKNIDLTPRVSYSPSQNP